MWDTGGGAYNLAFSTCLDAFRGMRGTVRCGVDEQDNREPFAQCCGTDLNCKRTHQADAGAAWGPTVNIGFPPMTPNRAAADVKTTDRSQHAESRLLIYARRAYCDRQRQERTLQICGEMKPRFVCFHSNHSITGPVMAALWQRVSLPLIPQTRDKVKASEALAPSIKYSVLSPDTGRNVGFSFLNLDQKTNIVKHVKQKQRSQNNQQINIQPPYLFFRVHCVPYFFSLFAHLSN